MVFTEDTFESAQAYALVNSSNYGDKKPQRLELRAGEMPILADGKIILYGP